MTTYITSLLAATLFYAIPIILGSSLVRLKDFAYYRVTGKGNLKDNLNVSYSIISVIRGFSYGAFVIYLEALIIDDLVYKKILDNGFTLNFVSVIFVSMLGTWVLALWVKVYLHKKGINRITFGKTQMYNVLTVITLVALSIATYVFWRWDSNTQTTLNWDIYHHQTLATTIGEGHFNLFTSNLSDSFQFNGYSTMFHTLISLPQSIIQVDILSFWWFAELLHLVVTVLLSYAIVQVITRSRWVGIIGGILGAFIFEAAVAFTSLFLIPQTLAAAVVVAFIAGIFFKEDFIDTTNYSEEEADSAFLSSFEDENPKSKVSLFSLDFIVFTAYILLNHVVIGSLGIFLVMFCSAYFYLSKTNKGKLFENVMLIASFLLFAVVPLIASQLDLNSINRGEAEFFNFSFSQKLNFFEGFYGYAIYVFLPLGYYYALRANSTRYKLLVILTNGLLSLILGPIPYAFKLLTIGRYVINAIMSLGIWFLIKDFGKVGKIMLLSILAMVLAVIAIINFDDFKQVPAYKGISTHVTKNEIEAANFLKLNYGAINALIVSDPATMHILEGLSGVNTPGGAYTSIYTRQTLSEIYFTRDKNITTKLLSVKDSLVLQQPDKVIFVVSGRFREWQLAPDKDKFGIHWNVWKPYDLSAQEKEDYEFIYYLEEILGYEEVYRNNGLIILEVPTL